MSFIFLVTAVIKWGDLTATQVDNSEKDAELTENKDQTTKNLEYALSGECEANRKYLAFSEIADQEGYPAVATLWRAAAAKAFMPTII